MLSCCIRPDVWLNSMFSFLVFLKYFGVIFLLSAWHDDSADWYWSSAGPNLFAIDLLTDKAFVIASTKRL